MSIESRLNRLEAGQPVADEKFRSEPISETAAWVASLDLDAPTEVDTANADE